MPATSLTHYRSAVAIGLLLLGSAGVAAAWTLFALTLDRLCGWMAVVAAIDAALLLRLARVPASTLRLCLSVLGTLLTIVIANWWIAGAQLGQMVGLPPWDAINRMGGFHGWTLITLANGTIDIAWYAIGLCVAALAAR